MSSSTVSEFYPNDVAASGSPSCKVCPGVTTRDSARASVAHHTPYPAAAPLADELTHSSQPLRQYQMQVLVRFRGVGDPHALAVEHDLPAGAEGDGAEVHGVRDRGRVEEAARRGFAAALASSQGGVVSAGWSTAWRPLEGEVLDRSPGEEAGILAVEAGHDRALLPDEQDALLVHRDIVRFDLARQAGLHAAVVPEQVQGRVAVALRNRKRRAQAGVGEVVPGRG